MGSGRIVGAAHENPAVSSRSFYWNNLVTIAF